jgi:ankyrin repeat protein
MIDKWKCALISNPLSLGQIALILTFVSVLVSGCTTTGNHRKTDYEQMTEAIEQGDSEKVSALLQAGYDAKRYIHLLKAASKGQHEIVKMLVEAGAPVDKEDVKGCTALTSAVEAGSIDTVKLLMEHGADVNHQAGAVVIVSTLQRSDQETVYTLAGRLGTGHTALSLAIIGQRIDLVEYLLAHKADPHKTVVYEDAVCLVPNALGDIVSVAANGKRCWSKTTNDGLVTNFARMHSSATILELAQRTNDEKLVRAVSEAAKQ